MKTIDLSNLSEKELKEELKNRKAQKENDRKAYKELVNESLPQIMMRIKGVSGDLQTAKLYLFESLKILLDTKCEVYDSQGENQSHTFSDEQGNTITYGFRVIDNWDDTVTVGIQKVRDFIQSLAKDDESAKLVHGINSLLKKDAKGNLKANRVIELTKWAEEIDNEQFTDAVNIIRKAYKPQRSTFFIDAYQTDAQGKRVNIPLSITSVDFPDGTDINSLFPVHEKYKN
ncbi:MAG: DUF3164 family protein [Tenacibaculum sp.]|nr:DUF3164 family protein [Tenacibaculum sp.]